MAAVERQKRSFAHLKLQKLNHSLWRSAWVAIAN